MRIALVDTTKRATVYPVALLKIGAWRRDKGDTCRLFHNRLPVHDKFDEIWLSTCFTFDIPHAVGMGVEAQKRANNVRVGGISATLLPNYFEREGLDVHRGLLEEAEEYHPDYSLEGVPEYSISYTSRGCVRKCPFCMVHRLEPEFFNRDDWELDIHPATRKVLFYDNNWLAKNYDDLERDVKKLRALVQYGSIKEIDFNQGLDCRLLTAHKADLLEGLPIRPIRFAFDGMHEDGHYQEAVRLMAERGFGSFVTYVLYNFRDTPQDFYYRLRESVALTEELGVAVDSFPMCYQPILEIDHQRGYVGKHWTNKKKKAFSALRAAHSGRAGTVTFHSRNTEWRTMREFEYWFGETGDEFNRLLSYPKIRSLLKRKQGALRMRRAMAGTGGVT